MIFFYHVYKKSCTSGAPDPLGYTKAALAEVSSKTATATMKIEATIRVIHVDKHID
jgi:hypothetical protein